MTSYLVSSDTSMNHFPKAQNCVLLDIKIPTFVVRVRLAYLLFQ